MENEAVEDAADHLKMWQIENMGPDKSSHSHFPMKVTTTHSTGKMNHNFARFVHVEKLRHTTPLDHVIFLDDDQYVPENFLSSLLTDHRPKGMTTWYGKIFQQDDATEIANYWDPVYGLLDLIEGDKWPGTFKYGGTGGSIFDSNLWLLDSQLMRLSRDLSSWAKIDDIWSSFVLDALLGWEMRRLTPPIMPIDIGDFRENGSYRRVMSGRTDSGIEMHLLELDLPSILKSSTWRDETVDKQQMFRTLQADFHWDVGLSEYELYQVYYQRLLQSKRQYLNCQDKPNKSMECFDILNNFIKLSILASVLGGENGVLESKQQMYLLTEAETHALPVLQGDRSENSSFRSLVVDLYKNMGIVEKNEEARFRAQAHIFFTTALKMDPQDQEAQDLLFRLPET